MFIARAIDVGHGNTKFTSANFSEGCHCQVFPSLAPVTQGRMNVGGGLIAMSQYVEIEVNGLTYAVGKDSFSSTNTNTTRIVDQNFATSDTYAALVNGALYYINEPKIDVLVLGLPMNTFEQHRDELRERMVGGHTIPNPAKAKNPRALDSFSVQVVRALVVPQPMGAFLNYCTASNRYEELKSKTNLVLDVGHGTFDYYIAKGNVPYTRRCGATFGGVHHVVKAIIDAINDESVRDNHAVWEDIDTALRTQSMACIDGEDIDICTVYKTTIDDAIRASVSRMMTAIGNITDIKHILLTGGGALLFKDEIQKAIGAKRELIIDADSIFSNVKGFQIAGEQWLKNLEATVL